MVMIHVYLSVSRGLLVKLSCILTAVYKLLSDTFKDI